MKLFKNIEDLLVNLNALDWNAWVYCDKDSWDKSPMDTPLYYLREDDVEEDSETGLPTICSEKNVTPFFEVETLKDIIGVFLKRHAKDVVDDIVYYRKNDTFKV